LSGESIKLGVQDQEIGFDVDVEQRGGLGAEFFYGMG
jgi:hypothetical protein